MPIMGQAVIIDVCLYFSVERNNVSLKIRSKNFWCKYYLKNFKNIVVFNALELSEENRLLRMKFLYLHF